MSFILHILLAAGTAVALGGLGTAAGTWELHGAYVGGRIHTSLQYPNTAAAYLTAVYFIALGLVTRVKRWYLRPVYLAPAVVIFITFIFTYSRGAWLLMPLLAVLFVLVVGRGERLRLVFYLSLSGLVTLLLVSRLDSALRGDNPALVWKYVFLAVLLILAGGLLAELFLSLRCKLQAAVAGVVALVIVVVGLQVVLPALGRPLHLARKPDEPPGHQYLEQRVGKISPGEKYMLALEVAATQEAPGGDEAEKKAPEYAWRLLILAYDREEERTTLLDHREGPTQGWEQREFELQPGEHTRRMEVRLYNYYPGTAVSARNVSLRDSRGERLLTFALNRMLPDRIYSRMFAISAGDKSVEGRLTFYRDALKIIRDYPLLGAGGGGWEALYFGYQEQRYHTTEVHNHFLQVWVEAGTPGFLAFVGIWVFFILSFWRRCFGRGGASTAEKHYWSTVCVPAVALGVHSAIDFNLSLGAVSIFLFALLGAGRSLDWDEGEGFVASLASGWRRKASSLSGLPSAVSAVGILAGIFMLTLSVSLWNGYRYGVEAEQRAGENRLPEAVELYDKAISYDPYQASYYAALGRIYENLANTEGNSDLAPRLQEMALDLTRRAQELEPFNPRYSLEYGAMLLRSGSIDAGLHCLERVIELSPQNPVFFVQVARGRLAAAEHYLALEDASQAGEQLREVLRLEERMSKLQGSAAPLNFYLGKAAYLLEDYARAASYLAEVGEKDENYEESLVYLAVLFEKQGEGEQAAELKEIFSANEALLELYRQLAASR